MSSRGRLEMSTKLEMLNKVENVDNVENETSSILRFSDTKKDDPPCRSEIFPSLLGVGDTASFKK